MSGCVSSFRASASAWRMQLVPSGTRRSGKRRPKRRGQQLAVDLGDRKVPFVLSEIAAVNRGKKAQAVADVQNIVRCRKRRQFPGGCLNVGAIERQPAVTAVQALRSSGSGGEAVSVNLTVAGKVITETGSSGRAGFSKISTSRKRRGSRIRDPGSHGRRSPSQGQRRACR